MPASEELAVESRFLKSWLRERSYLMQSMTSLRGSRSRLTPLFAVALIAVVAARAAPARADELKVVATIKPIHSLAAAVMEGVAMPRLLIEGASSPHTYALRPSDAKALHEAHIVLRVSAGLETFLVKVIKSLPENVRVVTLEEAEGVTLLALREGGAFDDHGHGHGHSHSHGGKKAGGQPPSDSHIWLDPENAKVMARHIARELAALRPADAARFDANANRLAVRLDELHKDLKTALAPLASKPFMTFHDAFQYLEKRYGLTSVGTVTVNPEVQPSARRIRALRQKVKKNSATCVFSEPQFEPALVTTITEGTQARSGVLDPLGAGLPPGPDLYPLLLRNIAKSLARCFVD